MKSFEAGGGHQNEAFYQFGIGQRSSNGNLPPHGVSCQRCFFDAERIEQFLDNGSVIGHTCFILAFARLSVARQVDRNAPVAVLQRLHIFFPGGGVAAQPVDKQDHLLPFPFIKIGDFQLI